MEYTLYQLLWFFLVYSFLGWLMETAAAAAKKGKLLNRGFLNAPFSPVYGEAAVLFAVFLPELKSAPFFLFVGGMLLATPWSWSPAPCWSAFLGRSGGTTPRSPGTSTATSV